MKKLVSILLVTLLVGSVFGGCNKKNGVGVSDEDIEKGVAEITVNKKELEKGTKPFKEAKCKLEGKSFKVPCTYKELAKTGFKLEKDESVEGNSIVASKPLTNSEGKQIVVVLRNTSKKKVKLSDCVVDTIVVDNVLGDAPKCEVNGVNFGDSKKQVIDKMGTSLEIKEERSANHCILPYMMNNSDNDYVTFQLKDDKVYSIQISITKGTKKK